MTKHFAKKMRYKAIFIDIDDTLLDYVPCCREAFDCAMEALDTAYGIQRTDRMTQDQLFDLFFDISGRLFSEAKRGLHTVAEVMELYPVEFIERADYPVSAVEPFKHAFRAAWGETHALVDGAQDMLSDLRNKGYRLFAASNSFGHLQRRRMERAGLLPYFEDMFISMDIGYDKPDVRFYQEALRRADLLPCDVLMVGDSMTTDIMGAQQAGLATCWFNRRNEQNDKARPDYMIAELVQLTDMLPHLNTK